MVGTVSKLSRQASKASCSCVNRSSASAAALARASLFASTTYKTQALCQPSNPGLSKLQTASVSARGIQTPGHLSILTLASLF